VWIDIHIIKRLDKALLQIEIRDNGQGMDTTQATEGVGLVGMRERIESLQGSFKLMSGLQAGTLITGLLPLNISKQGHPAASLLSNPGVNDYATS